MATKKSTPPDTRAQSRPVDYAGLARIGGVARLVDIRPSSFAARVERSASEDASSALVRVRARLESHVPDGILSAVEFHFTNVVDGWSTSIDGTFIVTYSLASPIDVDRSLVEQFAEVNATYNAWSYIRELVGSSVARLSAPQVTLPVWRPPAELPPSGTFLELRSQPAAR